MLKRGPDACPVGRVPAAEIKEGVIDELRGFRQADVIVGMDRLSNRLSLHGSGEDLKCTHPDQRPGQELRVAVSPVLTICFETVVIDFPVARTERGPTPSSPNDHDTQVKSFTAGVDSFAAARTFERRDLGAEPVGSGPERVVGEVRVAPRRHRAGVAEQPADDLEAQAARHQMRGVGMPVVVHPIVRQPGRRRDRFPEPLHVSQRPVGDPPRENERYRRIRRLLIVESSASAGADRGRCSVRFCLV